MARPQWPGHSASTPMHRLCSLDTKFTGTIKDLDTKFTDQFKEQGERLARIETKLNIDPPG